VETGHLIVESLCGIRPPAAEKLWRIGFRSVEDECTACGRTVTLVWRRVSKGCGNPVRTTGTAVDALWSGGDSAVEDQVE
jgi:hypothetical protein